MTTQNVSEEKIKIDIRLCEITSTKERNEILNSVKSEYSKENFNEKDFCFSIKTRLNRKLGPLWNVIAGRSFGFDVSYMNEHFIFFYINETAVAVYKSRG